MGKAVFKRKARKGCFYLLLLLGYVGDCFFLNVANTAETFETAFKGSSPFYAITVARDTVTESYALLTPQEERVVFAILTNLLSGDSREFLALSENLVRERERWFLQIKEALQKEEEALDSLQIADLTTDKAAASFSHAAVFRDFLGLKDDKEVCKNAIRAFISDSIERERKEIVDDFRIRLREGFRVPLGKASTPVFESKSQEMFSFVSSFRERIEKRKHDIAKAGFSCSSQEKTLFEEYESQIGDGDPHAFFGSIFSNIEKIARLSQRIHAERVKDNPCLVVFNEMFFSKDRPLSFEEFSAVAGAFGELTRRHANVLVHANFLFEEPRPFKDEADYGTFIGEQARRVDGLSTRTGKQIFESDRYRGYGEYAAQFSGYRSPLNILKNQSSVFWRGCPVTCYLKSSYRTEADTHLAAGKFYELGTGEDEVLPAVIGHPAEEEVARILKENISTEICYDLEIGVRKKLDSYPRDGKIHIVVSNTLSLAQLGRAENLPDHIPLIIHVDPKDQEILLRTETRAILLPDSLPGPPLPKTSFGAKLGFKDFQTGNLEMTFS